MTNEVTLSPRKAAMAARYALQAGIVPHFNGEPGISKTAIAEQIAKTEQMNLLKYNPSLKDPVDVAGIQVPDHEAKVALQFLPEIWPREGRWLFFIDEPNRASAMMQNALQEFIQYGNIGERYQKPEDSYIITAGNMESHGGGVQRMTSAFANRLLHLNVVPDLEDFCAYGANPDAAMQLAKLPGGPLKRLDLPKTVHPIVLAFVRFRPELLQKFDAKLRAWPSPRVWDKMVSQIAWLDVPDDEIELALYAGSVGYAAATEFMAFVRLYRTLPNIDGILLNPTTAPVPSDTQTLYAVSAALSRRSTVNNFGRVITYLERLPEEFNVFTVRDATRRSADLTNVPEFTTWAVNHADALT